MGLQGITVSYKGLQRLQGITKGYRGLQGITGGYKGLQGVRGGFKELQEDITWSPIPITIIVSLSHFLILICKELLVLFPILF